jgi:cysteine desulfurase/selenocysteine lyase
MGDTATSLATEPSASRISEGPGATGSAAAPSYDLERVRADFPILATSWNGHPLAYLDNAASAQKPRAVIRAVVDCYEGYYSNIERGVYGLAQRSTEGREQARDTVRRFLNAPAREEIVFVRGTTEAINLFAAAWGGNHVGPGDEVLVTQMEHHSSFVPWQQLCAARGATLRVAPVDDADDAGELNLDELEALLSPRTRVVAVTHVSNVLGTINPIRAIAERAHRVGALVVVDGAQAAPHLPIDVQALGCDAYAFSGHKVYAPSGIGVLWARRELLEAMPPWQSGGGMIRTVSAERTTFAPPPQRFEGGTPFIEGAIGLGAALDYLTTLGLDAIGAWEAELLRQATSRLGRIPGLRILGTARHKASVLSFVLDGVHPHDIGTLLDRDGIAVRVGHLCAQPLMARFGVPAVTRASFGLYNTPGEVEALGASVESVRELFA